MILIGISDTHNNYPNLNAHIARLRDEFPEERLVLTHAGDGTNRGTLHEVRKWFAWLESIPVDNIVFIAGNHDLGFDHHIGHPDTYEIKELIYKLPSHIVYLNNSETVIDEAKFYGSPNTPYFHSWAFNSLRSESLNNEVNSIGQLTRHPSMEAICNDIPLDTNVLITHGPPAYYNDIVPTGKYASIHQGGNVVVNHCGCEFLAKKVNEIVNTQSLIHFYGHIHEGYGIKHQIINNKRLVSANCAWLGNEYPVPYTIGHPVPGYYYPFIVN